MAQSVNRITAWLHAWGVRALRTVARACLAYGNPCIVLSSPHSLARAEVRGSERAPRQKGRRAGSDGIPAGICWHPRHHQRPPRPGSRKLFVGVLSPAQTRDPQPATAGMFVGRRSGRPIVHMRIRPFASRMQSVESGSSFARRRFNFKAAIVTAAELSQGPSLRILVGFARAAHKFAAPLRVPGALLPLHHQRQVQR